MQSSNLVLVVQLRVTVLYGPSPGYLACLTQMNKAVMDKDIQMVALVCFDPNFSANKTLDFTNNINNKVDNKKF